VDHEDLPEALVQIVVICTEPGGPHLFKIIRVAVTNVHGQNS
jgi:hypothetical protein